MKARPEERASQKKQKTKGEKKEDDRDDLGADQSKPASSRNGERLPEK